MALNGIESKYYWGVGNFVNLFQLSIEKSIVALMMAFIIIGADIDLSVASVMGLAACVMAWTFQQGAPLPLAISAYTRSIAFLCDTPSVVTVRRFSIQLKILDRWSRSSLKDV